DVSAERGMVLFKVNRQLLKLLEPFGNGEDEKFGLNSELFDTLKRGTTLVEYSSPNIAKKFHAGHLRSTVIGNFIANLKQSLGNNVIRMNYLGDWGMQFGLLGAGFGQFGCQEKLKKNPLQHLFEVYVQVNKEAEHDDGLKQAARDFFRQLEQHESQAVSLWQQFREITVTEYQHVYKRLGVHFDIYSGESFHQDQAQEVVQQLQSRGLLKTSEKGTGVVDLSPDRDMSSVSTVLRSDGTTLYITRSVRVKVVKQSQRKMCQHVPFGLVQGMKTRTGEVVFLEDVLDEARARMLHNMSQSKTTKEMDNPEDTAEKVGISALIVQVNNYRTTDLNLNLELSQVTVCYNTVITANKTGIQFIFCLEAATFDPAVLHEQTGLTILQHLLRYDEVLYQSAQDLQPKHLVNFLLKLCHLIASAHKELPVKGSPRDVAQVRLQLFRGACSVLANGMRILGITPVDKM
uniref:Probable arginine--tRNA ligase, mitochondrial n=1 Tax=Anabas testudineus TaxID=64144 RepID=A0A7N6BYE7_ANATE